MEKLVFETRRRSVTKALIWRLLGIAWTWTGAYLILLWVPQQHRSEMMLATLIVVYHHSTRMVMYYFYERLWGRIQWGRTQSASEAGPPLRAGARLLWGLGTLACLVLIFFLLLRCMPPKQKPPPPPPVDVEVHTEEDPSGG